MTRLQKLEAVKACHGRMVWAKQLMEETSARAESTTHRIKEVKVQSSADANWSEEIILQAIEARDCYEAAAEAYVESFAEAIKIIDGLPDPRWVDVLSGRYIKDMTWQQIADDTGQSNRNCMVLHKKALKWLEENAGN